MRALVVCASCARQLDATGLSAGSRFHCGCGAVLVVPRFRPHDAQVVRCSACGAPRKQGSLACEHCGADYTLHEQDLHTICPSCMARISDRARYCHHCATPIVPQGDAGGPTKQGCPACGRRTKLHSRKLGEVSILECTRCAGVWLSNEGFDVLRDRSLAGTAAVPPLSTPAPVVQRAAKVLYRGCPVCHEFMHRRNWGGGSGVVIDSCKDHGVWFDASELASILAWIRAGGEARVADRAREEARQQERLERFKLVLPSGAAEPPAGGASDPDLLASILGTLFRHTIGR
jgi:Zn-finger nucleic acid-binding protein